MASNSHSDHASLRTAKLSRLLDVYVKGDRMPKGAGDGKHLLEAISTQDDKVGCVERLIASKNAPAALKLALRFDISPSFFNNDLKDFLNFLRDPAIGQVCGGELLKQILTILVRPETLWDALLSAHLDKKLSPESEVSFAWLLLELVSWVDNPPIDVEHTARDITDRKVFLDARDRDLRAMGYRIEHILSAKNSEAKQEDSGPGGRHDNDHVDFRNISIFPTDDEITSPDVAFYRPADAVTQQPFIKRPGIHLDNQFRLLREDFLAELREDVSVAQGNGKSRRPRLRLKSLSLVGAYFGTARSKTPFSLTLSVRKGLEPIPQLDVKERKSYLKANPKFLKHQSFGCVFDQGRIITFATLLRVEDLLIQDNGQGNADEPLIVLKLPDTASLGKLLLNLMSSRSAEFIIVDTPVFAYEPVLRCLQSTVELPLWEELFAVSGEEIEAAVRPSTVAPLNFVESMEDDEELDLQSRLSLPKPVLLDESQMGSLLSGLRQSVSLIQGPPGTGKSFIGALLAKSIIQHTSEQILVLTYTNHALDQYLEDLLDIGIPPDSMVRLGAKSTLRTEPLQLFKQQFRGNLPFGIINAKRAEAEEDQSSLTRLIASLRDSKPDKKSVMEHLEFSEQDSDFFFAFQVPDIDSEEVVVGQRGKRITEHYLYDRWCHGQDAGMFQDRVLSEHLQIWTMGKPSRDQKIRDWTNQLLAERISGIGSLVDSYNRSENTLREAWEQKDASIIQSKRIVACTTTAAAKYTKHLRNAAPGIIMVEEAGEILESHILTAMAPSTKQLILIGDHQQLRPKVNNYSLTVEKGDGYDLNRSLFERLILAGFPHTTLCQQHRMRPEISSLVRQLTYPTLIDAPSTSQRDPVKGICGRVIFIDHRNPEAAYSKEAAHQDSSVSKHNTWEASMVLKTVRYMAQQGYGTSKQVVLTPYLGQLSLLRKELAKENDPILNDLDSFDLIRAGLMTSSHSASSKRPIRLSTIDNYQGEESDIVIASLTRSNNKGDIGFMSSPERLNVLLSRARNALIIIGDSTTFLASRKGTTTWRPFLELLRKNKNIHEGFPVQCEQHPDRKVVLIQPEDFDELCPEGGCLAPCGMLLKCGLHECPRKCHAQTDHSQMACLVLLSDECPEKHKMTWRCSDLRPSSCQICDEEAAAAAKRKKRDEELDQARQQKQAAYAHRLAEIQEEIDLSRRTMQEHQEDEEMEKTIRQREQDLTNARLQAERLKKQRHQDSNHTSSQAPVPPSSNPATMQAASQNSPGDPTASANAQAGASQNKFSAQEDWELQKRRQGASNDHLDELMAMIGLENVKEAFLDLKAKVDLAVRQGSNLATERFGVSLLGNPGTGKTTVARLYARFLSSVGALPGHKFCETTGSKLAAGGVKECMKMLEDITKSGGGALFIDEAYQLTSGNNSGGPAVLDSLLAEVENLTGKVVFILAGYNRNMEKFFVHNPGLPSRFPNQIQFDDYEDDELLEILNYGLVKRYQGCMKVEGGSYGLYARIVARRVGYGRGTIGFGNARAMENALMRITARQARRFRHERRSGVTSDDLLLTKEDLIGPKPSDVLSTNKSWIKLKALTGLAAVKESVAALFDSIAYNYQRELDEKPIMEFTLNKVFLGSPGTGKTTVAKLYGQILADIGLLSSNEVLLKTPADFVGDVIGASETKTKAILDAAKGKVLVIDEAYGLSIQDVFKQAVIDTIVSEVQNVPGDDRCVLLLGYKEQMEDMMQKINPGLARRFPIRSGFYFEDFTDAEMAIIFEAKLKAQHFVVTDKARSVALEVLSRMRNQPNFGNAGQIDILLNDAKVNQQKRFNRDQTPHTAILEAEDFDPDYKRGERAVTNVEQLFRGVVGCDGIVEQLKGYQNIANNMRDAGLDPRDELPFTFLFRGPPGTGKTTTARKMGKVYYDMGFLGTAEVIECSAKDLIGEHVGQTGPKTQKLLESALGKVLFVDEAYRLGASQVTHGGFAKEAVDELVDCITKPRFLNKIVIILAGYHDDINKMLEVNPGLSSRFSESVDFQALSAESCFRLLQTTLEQKKQLDSTLLSSPTADFQAKTLKKLNELAALGNFANGRDVQTLCKRISGAIMKTKRPTGEPRTVTEAHVVDQINILINERVSRTQSSSAIATPHTIKSALPMRTSAPDRPAQSSDSNANTTTATQPPKASQDVQPTTPNGTGGNDPNDAPQSSSAPIRDADVSDDVWDQLQEDTRLAEEEETERRRLAEEEEKLRQWLQKCADAQRQRDLEEMERKKRELDEKLRREAEEKAKLKKSGLCPRGYHWIRQNGGYRCAGGSHWVSDGKMQELA